jgi:hypothetical protein
MKFDDFRLLIQDCFSYLWDEFGFTIVEEKPNAGPVTMWIDVQSGACFFEFLLELGYPQVLVGTQWTDTTGPSIDSYAVQSVIDFLTPETRPKDWFRRRLKPPEGLGPDDRIEWTYRELAKQVRPHCANIIHLFQPEVYASVRKELKDFDKLGSDLFFQGHE